MCPKLWSRNGKSCFRSITTYVHQIKFYTTIFQYLVTIISLENKHSETNRSPNVQNTKYHGCFVFDITKGLY